METKKKLLAYVINDGEIIGIDTNTWYDSDLNGNEPFKIITSADTTPSGYTDITNIVNWDKFGINIANDYLVVKFEIRDIVNIKNWTGLTNTEKNITIKYYAYPNATDAAIHLISTQGMTSEQANGYLLQQWHLHHGKLLTATNRRWYYVKLVVPQFLSFADAEDLFDTAQPLIYEYTQMGRLGIDYGDNNNGIMDYLMSTNGFVGQGMEENNYTLINGSWDTFKEELHKVLVCGIYTKYDNDNFEI